MRLRVSFAPGVGDSGFGGFGVWGGGRQGQGPMLFVP